MKHYMFTYFDSKGGFYSKPMFTRSKGEAIRSFSDEVNREDSYLAAHPEDFTLFELGIFDDCDCSMELLSTPNSVGKAIEFKKVEPEPFRLAKTGSPT